MEVLHSFEQQALKGIKANPLETLNFFPMSCYKSKLCQAWRL